MIYKGSRDGFDASVFHLRCDNMGASVSFIRTKNGFSIAGYTSSSWSSPDKGIYVSDPTAMVLNLTSKKSFPCKQKDWAIYCTKNNGPYFGNGELRADSPFNQGAHCASSINGRIYGITASDDGLN